ncbi:GGDEF domain-containing protein [Thiohalophilus thiocyanatoxydans]|uniref:diguanylate cyclase n=1 Tax=Thiohalophilus thiocyanatoxydans TaxID=381308 RepID=A0A4R8IKG1_9GAMM|nr:GGDEF domain-containing protein [Thiohalophilus thiocyanatoxydans]TDY00574.1 diguanylate cyclase (GGDEF)-like protein [Thiohalophilus thiocyanatoxydans]
MENFRRDIAKLYLVMVVSGLTLILTFYLFGFRPLVDRLHEEHEEEIVHYLDGGLWLLQGMLDKHYDLARQSASRTAIRNRQIAYLDGKVSKEELVAFSAPKLSDALGANREAVGISRFDPGGNLLFSVGVALPEHIVNECNLRELDEIRMLGRRQVGNEEYLVYCSNIADKGERKVGADILVMDDVGIEKIVESTLDEQGCYAIVKDGEIIYWPHGGHNVITVDVLETYLDSGEVDEAHIVKSRYVEGHNWQLYAVVNRDRFFADIDRQLLILIGILLVVLLVVILLSVIALRPIIRTLLREKELFELSHQDGLTGLFNHAYMQTLLDNELERARRFERPLSVLLFDLDHFKQVNDNYGHQAGDKVLRHVGEVILSEIRQIDLAARYGGEEFMVILPETDAEGAQVLAERLRCAISQKTVSTSAGEVHVTISVGVATCNSCYEKHDVIEVADNALYTSKANGRNQVTRFTLEAV